MLNSGLEQSHALRHGDSRCILANCGAFWSMRLRCASLRGDTASAPLQVHAYCMVSEATIRTSVTVSIVCDHMTFRWVEAEDLKFPFSSQSSSSVSLLIIISPVKAVGYSSLIHESILIAW